MVKGLSTQANESLAESEISEGSGDGALRNRQEGGHNLLSN